MDRSATYGVDNVLCKKYVAQYKLPIKSHKNVPNCNISLTNLISSAIQFSCFQYSCTHFCAVQPPAEPLRVGLMRVQSNRNELK